MLNIPISIRGLCQVFILFFYKPENKHVANDRFSLLLRFLNFLKLIYYGELETYTEVNSLV